MTRPDPEVAALLRPDGSVIVPAAVAGEVLRSLVRDLTAQTRANGGEVSPAARRVFYALHTAAEQRAEQPPATADSGSPEGPHATVEVTVDQAAALLECRARWVRQHIADGRLKARRAGARLWLVDNDSLTAYRRGNSPCQPNSEQPASEPTSP